MQEGSRVKQVGRRKNKQAGQTGLHVVFQCRRFGTQRRRRLHSWCGGKDKSVAVGNPASKGFLCIGNACHALCPLCRCIALARVLFCVCSTCCLATFRFVSRCGSLVTVTVPFSLTHGFSCSCSDVCTGKRSSGWSSCVKDLPEKERESTVWYVS